MDQEIETSRIVHVARLALVALGLVLGFLLLSAVFGSSSASAATRDDDPNPAWGSTAGVLVESIVEPVAVPVAHTTAHIAKPSTDAVQTLAHAAPAAAITAPLAAIADDSTVAIATEIVGPEVADHVLAGGPLGTLLAPLAGFVDDTLAGAAGTLTVSASAMTLADDAAPAVPTTVTSPVATAGAALIGIAAGVLDGATTDPGDGPAAGVAGGSGLIPVALLGAGLFALLAIRRGLRLDPALPGSPIFDTDSSPD